MAPKTAMLLVSLLIPAAAAAAPEPAFEPLAFLAGHCWKGTMPDKSTDTHCFSWVFDGKFLRDRHVVRGGDKTIYEGETLYYWDSEAKELEYLYLTAQGGHTKGRVAKVGDELVFPPAKLVVGTKSFGFRATWKRQGEDAYEVLREYETDKGWTPIKLEMQRVK